MAGGFNLEISDLEDTQLQDAFRDLTELGNDLTPAWRAFAEVLQESHMERWQLEVAPDGDPWEALALSTKRSKARRGYDASRILYEEGDLLRGLVTDPGADELLFGIADWKAPVHHFGTDDIPARPLVGLSRDDRAALLEILQDEIEERWG